MPCPALATAACRFCIGESHDCFACGADIERLDDAHDLQATISSLLAAHTGIQQGAAHDGGSSSAAAQGPAMVPGLLQPGVVQQPGSSSSFADMLMGSMMVQLAMQSLAGGNAAAAYERLDAVRAQLRQQLEAQQHLRTPAPAHAGTGAEAAGGGADAGCGCGGAAEEGEGRGARAACLHGQLGMVLGLQADCMRHAKLAQQRGAAQALQLERAPGPGAEETAAHGGDGPGAAGALYHAAIEALCHAADHAPHCTEVSRQNGFRV